MVYIVPVIALAVIAVAIAFIVHRRKKNKRTNRGGSNLYILYWGTTFISIWIRYVAREISRLKGVLLTFVVDQYISKVLTLYLAQFLLMDSSSEQNLNIFLLFTNNFSLLFRTLGWSSAFQASRSPATRNLSTCHFLSKLAQFCYIMFSFGEALAIEGWGEASVNDKLLESRSRKQSMVGSPCYQMDPDWVIPREKICILKVTKLKFTPMNILIFFPNAIKWPTFVLSNPTSPSIYCSTMNSHVHLY